MKNFVKFIMSKGEPLSFPIEKAEAIMKSAEQIVLEVENGKWTGRSINKAHIVSTYPDNEADYAYRIRNTDALPDPSTRKRTTEEQARLEEELKKTREVLSEKMGWEFKKPYKD